MQLAIGILSAEPVPARSVCQVIILTESIGSRLPIPQGWSPFGAGTRRCPGSALAMHVLRVVAAKLLPDPRFKPSVNHR